MSFLLVRQRRKLRQHDYECFDEREQDLEKLLETHFFFALADAALVSLNERFQLIKKHLELFGFLLSTETLKSCSQNQYTKFVNIMSDVDSLQLKSEIQW